MHMGQLHLLVVAVILHSSLNANGIILFEKGSGFLQILFLHKNLRSQRIRIIRKGEAENGFSGTGGPFIHLNNQAFHRYQTAILRDILKRNGGIGEVSSIVHVTMVGTLKLELSFVKAFFLKALLFKGFFPGSCLLIRRIFCTFLFQSSMSSVLCQTARCIVYILLSLKVLALSCKFL